MCTRINSDKKGRIESLQAIIATGMLKFSRRHAMLLEQLLQFPHADHDDGPDALQMAVEVARQPTKGWVATPGMV